MHHGPNICGDASDISGRPRKTLRKTLCNRIPSEDNDWDR